MYRLFKQNAADWLSNGAVMLPLINGSSTFPAALYWPSSCGIDSVTALSGTAAQEVGTQMGDMPRWFSPYASLKKLLQYTIRCGMVSWEGGECPFPSAGCEVLGFNAGYQVELEVTFLLGAHLPGKPQLPCKGGCSALLRFDVWV